MGGAALEHLSYSRAPPTAEPALTTLATDLDLAFQRVAAALPANTAIEIERVDGKDQIHVDRLDKLEEPPTLLALRRRVSTSLPRVDLAEALLEVHARTGFLDEFTPLGGSLGRPPNPHIIRQANQAASNA